MSESIHNETSRTGKFGSMMTFHAILTRWCDTSSAAILVNRLIDQRLCPHNHEGISFYSNEMMCLQHHLKAAVKMGCKQSAIPVVPHPAVPEVSN